MWRFLYVVGTTVLLAACGGGGGSGNSTPPSALSYPSPEIAVVGMAISFSPTVTGGSVTSYAVSPALPAGLAINATTGVISGTPSSASTQSTYTITASNNGGSTAFDWVLTSTYSTVRKTNPHSS